MRDELLEAAKDLRSDMIMRAKLKAHENDGEIVVDAGMSVWARFNTAIQNEDQTNAK